ncbi:hypothetical protein PUNSTDRAFT_134950 [Punctularia strigosozonata HHB-11173 SS5]|uniref:uncharacterized protein n=1 Tax=Punctularia strigosozonata (strain HHB-11173) TaxID=741275 RepID=UPI00044166FE|nr:uncharacterized protein PUNSTDRAFT_134950 [Punctularia strigosozonata HHB-11173 SS5]EIN08577.1 hypothetical protein PUNSTDRAFT_134950 [Punctularia strigosozonata HHB-11173 SS5]
MFALRVDHNASVPVHRLPIELLQAIFVLSYDPPTPFFEPPDTYNHVVPDVHWPIVLAQVCGRWRQVALDIPSLWTSLTVSTFPTLSLALAERYSKEHLRLFYAATDGAGSGPLNVMTTIIANDRARILELGIYRTGTPALERLDIDTSGVSLNENGERVCEFESRLAKICAPALRDLRMQCLIFPSMFDSQLLRSPNIRFLFLVNIPIIRQQPRASSSDILDILDHLPCLETLHLSNCLMHEPGGVASRAKPNLRSLREFEIWGNCCDCMNILGNVVLAQHLRRFSFSCGAYQCPRCVELVPELWKVAETTCDVPRELLLQVDWSDCCQVVVRGRDLPRKDPYLHPSALQFQGQVDDDIWAIFGRLQNVIPPARVIAIAFLGARPWSHPDVALRDALGRWSSVSDISVTHRGATMAVLKALRTDDASQLDRSRMILPDLTSMTVSDITTWENLRWSSSDIRKNRI